MKDMDILHLDYEIDTEDNTSWKKMSKYDIESTDKNLYRFLAEKFPIILHTEDFEDFKCYKSIFTKKFIKPMINVVPSARSIFGLIGGKITITNGNQSYTFSLSGDEYFNKDDENTYFKFDNLFIVTKNHSPELYFIVKKFDAFELSPCLLEKREGFDYPTINIDLKYESYIVEKAGKKSTYKVTSNIYAPLFGICSLYDFGRFNSYYMDYRNQLFKVYPGIQAKNEYPVRKFDTFPYEIKMDITLYCIRINSIFNPFRFNKIRKKLEGYGDIFRKFLYFLDTKSAEDLSLRLEYELIFRKMLKDTYDSNIFSYGDKLTIHHNGEFVPITVVIKSKQYEEKFTVKLWFKFAVEHDGTLSIAFNPLTCEGLKNAENFETFDRLIKKYKLLPMSYLVSITSAYEFKKEDWECHD